MSTIYSLLVRTVGETTREVARENDEFKPVLEE
jgi:hypothetical protein